MLINKEEFYTYKLDIMNIDIKYLKKIKQLLLNNKYDIRTLRQYLYKKNLPVNSSNELNSIRIKLQKNIYKSSYVYSNHSKKIGEFVDTAISNLQKNIDNIKKELSDELNQAETFSDEVLNSINRGNFKIFSREENSSHTYLAVDKIITIDESTASTSDYL